MNTQKIIVKGKLVSIDNIFVDTKQAEIELSPEELAGQMREQGYETLQHSDNKKIAIILPQPQQSIYPCCNMAGTLCPIHGEHKPQQEHSHYCVVFNATCPFVKTKVISCSQLKTYHSFCAEYFKHKPQQAEPTTCDYYMCGKCLINSGTKKAFTTKCNGICKDYIPEPTPPQQELPQNISIDILVDAYEGGNLISPFRLGKQEIQTLGIYEEKGIKFWVILKDKYKPILPKAKKEIEPFMIYEREHIPSMNIVWNTVVRLQKKMQEVIEHITRKD